MSCAPSAARVSVRARQASSRQEHARTGTADLGQQGIGKRVHNFNVALQGAPTGAAAQLQVRAVLGLDELDLAANGLIAQHPVRPLRQEGERRCRRDLDGDDRRQGVGGGGARVRALLRQLGVSPLLAAASGFAQRAAVAHAVYAPDARRAVEVDAEHEDQLVAWLSKRMGARMQAPRLRALGYELVGGRLLPGESKPVAQFMYQDGSGSKLTLYASNELPGAGVPTATPNADTAFSFAQRGALNTFYWVDGEFGYALSAGADRAELARVSAEVYRQLASGARQ